jgi:ABC-2 type transport system ATP-binding protein
VSHALDQIGDLCDRAVVLHKGVVVLDGSPRDALSTLRADHETARQDDHERRQQSPGQQAEPATRATVEAVRVLGPEGAPMSKAEPGNDLILEATVLAHAQTLTDWVLGVGIDTPLGQARYGTHTGLLGFALPDLRAGERRSFRFKLDDVRLDHGDYYVHAAVAETSGIEPHRLPQGAMLSISAGPESVGPLAGRARLLSG